MDLDRLFETLLKGLEQNTGLDEMKEMVNSIHPVDKYTLLLRILSNKETLDEETRLNSLPIFLDERTKFFNFIQFSNNQRTIKSILELIPRCCPNIKTIDLRNFLIKSENKENFKRFLIETKSLKTLRVTCGFAERCAIRQLLNEENFDRHHPDVRIGLLKIEYIFGIFLNASECIRLLKLLPNLKTFGYGLNLAEVMPLYIDDDDQFINKLSNITQFYDDGTSLSTLEHLITFCPKLKGICLSNPNTHVLENLSKFPLLKKIVLECEDFVPIRELVELLKSIGNQIKTLIIVTTDNTPLDPKIFYDLCPKLVKFEINPTTVFF